MISYRSRYIVCRTVRSLILGRRNFSNQSLKPRIAHSAEENVRLIRNIGIIAHIDAGKTTTTERILYVVGDTRHQGKVDTGDTVTDYMPQERERGITIQSAAVSLGWGGYNINLIDTPGHVDFSVEVERSIRVLDGAVLVLDSVAGVQAQTETVWRTANKYQIPAVAFLNKMDRQGADMSFAVSSLRSKLGINPIPIQVPIGTESNFYGAIDLISMEAITYMPDSAPKRIPTNESFENSDIIELNRMSMIEIEQLYPGIEAAAKEGRRCMLECIAEVDEIFMDTYLTNGEENGTYSVSTLLDSIRRICLSRQGVPVICGASLRGVGVEPLLDSIIAFLPSPLDRDPPKGRLSNQIKPKGKGSKSRKKRAGTAKHDAVDAVNEVVVVDPLSNELVALAFKVIHDKRREPLVFVRVYSGELGTRCSVYNSNKNVSERSMHLFQIHADEYKSVDSVKAGQVAAIIGLKHTYTGDTITSDIGRYKGLQLSGVYIPQPVFSIAIEPERSDQQDLLDTALRMICREDPSVVVETDQDTGQTVLKGIGELHLEVVCDRLRTEFNVPVETGRVYIAYHEGITHDISISEDFDRELIPGRRMFAGLDLSITRLTDQNATCEVELSEDADEFLTAQESDELLNCLVDACGRGPIGGYPMFGMHICVTHVRKDNDTSLGALRYAANTILLNGVRQAGIVLLEPVMACEIAVMPPYLGSVLNDLNSHRRAIIRNVNTTSESELTNRALDRYVLHATVPLRELLGYASSLRALSAGEASFTMHLEGYTPTESFVTQQVLKNGY